MLAIINKNVRMFDYIMDNNLAKVNVQDNKGLTALHHALVN